jgi:mannose-6-phosphate isomerase-like protein (cupin superfamily)
MPRRDRARACHYNRAQAAAMTQTARTAFDHLLDATRALYAARPTLGEFCPMPTDLDWDDAKPALDFPVSAHVQGWQAEGTGPDATFHRAVQAGAPHAFWTRTYSEAEVGAHFLANYGYFELFGPTGHYQSATARGYVAYWGAGLEYDWHRHEAEELYYVVSGGGLFLSEGAADALLGPGETRLHRSNQPHALHLTQGPILTFILWRGDGMDGLPSMGRG